MSEQQLREAVNEVDQLGGWVLSDGEGDPSFDAIMAAVGRLLDPIPTLEELAFGHVPVELALIERALVAYRAWLIGGEQ